MMLEVLKRRFTRGKEEADLPDLIVVDGGRGQLAMALTAMAELGIDGVDAVGLAKMRVQAAPRSGEIERSEERVFLPGTEQSGDSQAQLQRAVSFAAGARRSPSFRDHASSQTSLAARHSIRRWIAFRASAARASGRCCAPSAASNGSKRRPSTNFSKFPRSTSSWLKRSCKRYTHRSKSSLWLRRWGRWAMGGELLSIPRLG